MRHQKVRVFDREDCTYIIGWDGTSPDVNIIDGSVFSIGYKALGCTCDPTYGSTCGSCSDYWDSVEFDSSKHIVEEPTGFIVGDNGLEIYEGDQLRSNHFIDDDSKQHYIFHTVKWVQKYGQFMAINNECDHKEWSAGNMPLYLYLKEINGLKVADREDEEYQPDTKFHLETYKCKSCGWDFEAFAEVDNCQECYDEKKEVE